MLLKQVAQNFCILYSNTASTFQRVENNPLNKYFRSTTIPYIFANALSYRTTATPVRVVKTKLPNSSQSNLESNKVIIISFDEYKKNFLITFDQYKEKHIMHMKCDERGSAYSKLNEAYDCYARMSYQAYKEKFFPPPNPLIF